jgi:site-specific recombinase XerD
MKASVILFTGKKVREQWEGDRLVYFEHPLMLRLVDGKNRKHISLKISLPPERWDLNKQAYIPKPITRGMSKEQKALIEQENAEILDLITSNLNKYNSQISELKRRAKHVSLDSLFEMVEKPVKRDYTVYQYYDFLIKEFRETNRIGQVQIYTHSLNTLKKFLDEKDISFDEIDLPFLNRFDRFLRRRELKLASLSIQFRTLRSALNKAIKEGYANQYPFSDFKVVKGEPNKRALSIKEMDKLLTEKKINNNSDHYRMMLFSYYTVGMNFVDMCRLTWDNIRDNEIHYTRQKIHHRMIIPIHPKVREILNYYRQITGNMPDINGLNDQYIFPILQKKVHITEQQIADRIQKKRKQFNDDLKSYGKTAKIEMPITSYVLRHSAITHLVRAGVNIDAIQALAGHKKLSTTEGYIKEASQEQKHMAVNML